MRLHSNRPPRRVQEAEVEDWDVLLVGAGVMSATLGVLLSELQPDWRILVLERLDQGGMESSMTWNNAGTGHAGLCEFNYTPRRSDGSVDASGAVAIAEEFVVSLLFWAHLVERGAIGPPETFIRSVPHMGFGRGSDGVAYLRARWESLREHPLFSDLKFSDDWEVLARWLPLMFSGRLPGEPVAATRSMSGTDIDFGALTRQLLAALTKTGADVRFMQQVQGMRRTSSGWRVATFDRHTRTPRQIQARFVFIGAGGGTFPLLQSARVPEVSDYAVFPMSGQFLRSTGARLTGGHQAKVYGHAAPGAPPISVPHLDSRVVDGKEYLLFGPFAAFSPRLLRHGRRSDLVRTLRPGNIPVLFSAVRHNVGMVAYLVRQIAQTHRVRMAALRHFAPSARDGDWELVTAGQRVQVLKKTDGRGTMVGFGTEIVISGGGSLAALLGASPGASAAASTMVDVLARAFPDRMPNWEHRLRELAPASQYFRAMEPEEMQQTSLRARKVLGLV